MKDFIRDFYLFQEGFWLSIITWVITLAIFTGTFFLIDYCGGSAHDSVGIQNGRYYSPAYYQMIWHSDGNGGGYMQTIYYPESWSIYVYAEGDNHNFGCSEWAYSTMNYKDTIYCTLVTGCMTDIVYSGHLK